MRWQHERLCRPMSKTFERSDTRCDDGPPLIIFKMHPRYGLLRNNIHARTRNNIPQLGG